MNRIANGERILIDGATGTEVERRGVPQLENAWNGGGALSHSDVLRSVHEDYIREGAEIVIANTFATHRHALRDAGVEHQFEAFNRRGVELAMEARERMQAPDVLVAGGLSYWSWSGNWPAPEGLRTSTEEQASIMAKAGADLLMLEMMVDIDRMLDQTHDPVSDFINALTADIIGFAARGDFEDSHGNPSRKSDAELGTPSPCFHVVDRRQRANTPRHSS